MRAVGERLMPGEYQVGDCFVRDTWGPTDRNTYHWRIEEVETNGCITRSRPNYMHEGLSTLEQYFIEVDYYIYFSLSGPVVRTKSGFGKFIERVENVS